MKLTGAFGMDEVAFVGYHAANPTIFGTWSGGGGAGDLFLGYKELTPGQFTSPSLLKILQKKRYNDRLNFKKSN
jgi:hypothetical protein